MTQPNRKAVPQINDLSGASDTGNAAPQSPLEGEFLKRRRRRRLDLKSLHGTMRESARVYRELSEGRISMAEAEVRSRVLRRHQDVLAAFEENKQLTAIRQQLERLQGGSAGTSLPALELDPHPHGEVPP